MFIDDFLFTGPGVIALLAVLLFLSVWMGWLKVGGKNKNKVLGVSFFGFIGAVVWSFMVTGMLFGLAGEGQQLAVPPTTQPTTTQPTTTTGTCTGQQLTDGYFFANGQCICLQDGDVTLTLLSKNKHSLGTAVTGGGAHRLFLDGVDKGLFTDGATTKASPGSSIRFIAEENSSNGTVNGAYSHEIITTAKCKPTQELVGQVCQYDSSPTVTFWTENTVVIDSSNAQAMGADTSFNLPFRIQPSNNQCYGNPNHPGSGNVMCLEYNKTAFKGTELKEISIVGTDLKWTSKRWFTPNAITVEADNSTDCWTLPVVENSKKLEGVLVVTTDGTNDPQATDDIDATLHDVDIDLDDDTLETINDIEDENKNDLGTSDPIVTSTINVS